VYLERFQAISAFLLFTTAQQLKPGKAVSKPVLARAMYPQLPVGFRETIRPGQPA
jgi:hypothetical protein